MLVIAALSLSVLAYVERARLASMLPQDGASKQSVGNENASGVDNPEYVESTGSVEEIAADATALMKQGRFDEALALLGPLLDTPSPSPQVLALRDQIEAAASRNTALLAKIGRQQQAGDWSGVLTSIAALAKIRPLSPELIRLRTKARNMVRETSTTQRIEAGYRRALALEARGAYREALTVADQTLQIGADNRVQALRDRVARQLATPSTPGGGGGAPPPPTGSTGGGGSGTTNLRPPTSPPNVSAPKPPSVPNTSGGGITPPAPTR
jgi:tetratricopeptide (TPR) repeat protein